MDNSNKKNSSNNSNNIIDEVETVYPLLTYCNNEYLCNRMQAFDVVGVFILSFLSKRRPRKWATGLLSSSSSSSSLKRNSRTIESIPGLVDLIDKEYLIKKISKNNNKLTTNNNNTSNITIIDIFATLRFAGIKKNTDDYINISMINWCEGKRPFILMHDIPTPMDVLKQQANGQRVVTLFLQKDELLNKHVSKLTYMAGEIEHPRDALEFLLHDLKHMEHFINADTYEEQIGYFKAMLSLNNGKPKSFFKEMNYDIMLWYELEYCISDMNCYVPHFLHYMLAKLLFATERLVKDNNGIVKEDFVQLACSEPNLSYPSTYKQLNTTTNTTANTTITTTINSNNKEKSSCNVVKITLQQNWNKFLNSIGLYKCNNCNNNNDDNDNDCKCPFMVASNMVKVSYGTKPPMSAEEGEILRNYFKNYWQ